jgi:hypothetical protein
LGQRPEHPFRATLSIATNGLRAGDLATRDLWCADISWSCRDAAHQMTQRGFDIAPLEEDPLRRFVRRDDLESGDADRPAADVAQPIDTTHIVTVDLGLADTLELLEKRGFLFVIEGGSVAGIITLADIQRIPVGMVVLSMILATELGLNELILRHYGDEQLAAHLPDDRRRLVLTRYAQLKTWNVDARHVDVLQLEDRLRLVGEVDRFRAELVYTTPDAFESWTEELKRLRNSLAHGRTLLDHQPDAHRALQLTRRVREFAEAVWDLVDGDGPKRGDRVAPPVVPARNAR